MTAVPLSDVLEAAAFALIGKRWHQAHIHDVRGEIQTLRNAIELLSRAAKVSGDNPAALEKSAALAKRAMDGHEKALAVLVRQMTPHEAANIPVNVGELVADVLRFLRVGASIKSIVFNLDSIPDALVVAQPYKCRLLILGICTVLIDELDPGAVAEIIVARSGSDVVMAFKSALPCPAVRSPEELWHSVGTSLRLYELLLALNSQWAAANGCRIECGRDAHTQQVTDAQSVLRICYPAA